MTPFVVRSCAIRLQLHATELQLSIMVAGRGEEELAFTVVPRDPELSKLGEFDASLLWTKEKG